MPKKSLALILSGWMMLVSIFTSMEPYAAAQSNRDPQARHAANVKRAIERLGTGGSTHVSVELYDKTKLSGSLAEIADDQFVLRDANSSKDTPIQYSSVKKLKGDDPGLSKKIAFGAAAFQSKAAIIVVVALLATVLALVATDKS
jgi:hypothetical protein